MTLKLTKADPFTNEVNSMDLPITMKEYLAWKDSGEVIQKHFPQLSDNQREFMMTGLMPDSWDEIFKDSEDTPNGTQGDDPAF